MLQTLHVQAHAAGSSSDGANGCFHIGSSHVRLFGLGDFFQLSTGNSTHFLSVRTTRTALDTSCLFQQNRRRRSLGDEREAAIAVYGDNGRNRQTRFYALGLGVKRLTEFHDVNTTLTQRGTNWGTRVGLTGSNLKLDIGFNLLCHDRSPVGSNAFRLPGSS